jgi:hypothetical protein
MKPAAWWLAPFLLQAVIGSPSGPKPPSCADLPPQARAQCEANPPVYPAQSLRQGPTSSGRPLPEMEEVPPSTAIPPLERRTRDVDRGPGIGFPFSSNRTFSGTEEGSPVPD